LPIEELSAKQAHVIRSDRPDTSRLRIGFWDRQDRYTPAYPRDGNDL
jgi:hypothetical protein